MYCIESGVLLEAESGLRVSPPNEWSAYGLFGFGPPPPESFQINVKLLPVEVFGNVINAPGGGAVADPVSRRVVSPGKDEEGGAVEKSIVRVNVPLPVIALAPLP